MNNKTIFDFRKDNIELSEELNNNIDKMFKKLNIKDLSRNGHRQEWVIFNNNGKPIPSYDSRNPNVKIRFDQYQELNEPFWYKIMRQSKNGSL